MIGIAARHGCAFSFWKFTKNGLIVTAMTLLVACPYIWLGYTRPSEPVS